MVQYTGTSIGPATANRTGRASCTIEPPDTVLGVGTRLELTLVTRDASGTTIDTLTIDETTDIVIELWDWLQYINIKYSRLWLGVEVGKAQLGDLNYRLDFAPIVNVHELEITSFAFTGIYNNYRAPGFYINGDSLTDAPPDGSTPIRSWAFLLRDDGRIHPDSVIDAQGGRALFDTGYPAQANPSENVQFHILFLSSNDALARAFGVELSDEEHAANVQAYLNEADSRGFTGAYKILPPIQLVNTGEWPAQVLELRDVERDLLGDPVPWNVQGTEYIDSVHYTQEAQADVAEQMWDYIISRVPKIPTPIVDVVDTAKVNRLIHETLELDQAGAA